VLKAISRFERRGIKPTVRQIHYHFTELKPPRIPNIKKAYSKLDEVQIRNNSIKCLYDDSSDCIHVGFALALPEVRRILNRCI
jgi:hypothetical protein